MIEAKALSKAYGQVDALKDASFSIGAHEVVGLLGPNGAGKTTLMKILAGYMHPTAGVAEIDGINVVDETLAVQERIGYLPENAPLYPDMVVQEYLQMFAELREIADEQRDVLIAEAVCRTGLKDYLLRTIGELSKGYRQRVGLAQAILHKPKVLILDEPTSGLDPTQIVEIRRLIKELAKNSTVLLSTHILPEVELTCERVLIINEGQVRSDARLDDLKASDTAIVSVDGEASAVTRALQAIKGVSVVSETARTNSFISFRVVAEHADLCPAIFDAVRAGGWRMAELRSDSRTLESVFRDVVERGRFAQ